MSSVPQSAADDSSDPTWQPDSQPVTPGGKQKRKSAPRGNQMRWDAEKDQFLLLALVSVLSSKKIDIMDEVGRFFKHPRTGESIHQHLSKVRQAREKAGQDVPPATNGPGSKKKKADPTNAAENQGDLSYLLYIKPQPEKKPRAENKSKSEEKKSKKKKRDECDIGDSEPKKRESNFKREDEESPLALRILRMQAAIGHNEDSMAGMEGSSEDDSAVGMFGGGGEAGAIGTFGGGWEANPLSRPFEEASAMPAPFVQRMAEMGSGQYDQDAFIMPPSGMVQANPFDGAANALNIDDAVPGTMRWWLDREVEGYQVSFE